MWPPPGSVPEQRQDDGTARRSGPVKRQVTAGERAARAHARAFVSKAVWAGNKQAVSYLFDEDGFYENLADKLIENLPRGRRTWRGHWLCKQLKDAAEGLDPDTYAKLAGETVRDGLRKLGLPRYMADALGAGAGVTLKIQFGTTPLGNLSKTLRVLIPLVCPRAGRCPARDEFVKTMCSPAIGDHLKEIANGGWRT